MRIIKRVNQFLRYTVIHGISNLVEFFPVVWGFHGFDHSFMLHLILQGLKHERRHINNSTELYDEPRIQRVAAIDRVIVLIERRLKCFSPSFRKRHPGSYPSVPECDAIQFRDWEEMWQIISGDENIPGSDMRDWWG